MVPRAGSASEAELESAGSALVWLPTTRSDSEAVRSDSPREIESDLLSLPRTRSASEDVRSDWSKSAGSDLVWISSTRSAYVLKCT